MPDSALSFDNVTQRFDNGYVALEEISFGIARRRFVAIVGPSGCGKSTLLNLAAGLVAPSSGAVTSFGATVAGINRHAAYMFQQDALLPWKTVAENAALGLTFRGLPADRATAWLDRAGLAAFANSYPSQLSGGMRKRAAMAQCLAVEPDLLLMDEPFSALDVHTRQRMEEELLALWSQTQATVVFVTHDLEEAITLADEVMVLSAGPASRIVGRYEIALDRPRSLMDLKTDARFVEIYSSIWHDLRAEVIRSRA